MNSRAQGNWVVLLPTLLFTPQDLVPEGWLSALLAMIRRGEKLKFCWRRAGFHFYCLEIRVIQRAGSVLEQMKRGWWIILSMRIQHGIFSTMILLLVMLPGRLMRFASGLWLNGIIYPVKQLKNLSGKREKPA